MKNQEQYYDKEISLFDILSVIVKLRKLFIISFLCLLILGFALVFYKLQNNSYSQVWSAPTYMQSSGHMASALLSSDNQSYIIKQVITDTPLLAKARIKSESKTDLYMRLSVVAKNQQQASYILNQLWTGYLARLQKPIKTWNSSQKMILAALKQAEHLQYANNAAIEYAKTLGQIASYQPAARGAIAKDQSKAVLLCAATVFVSAFMSLIIIAFVEFMSLFKKHSEARILAHSNGTLEHAENH